MSADTPPSFQLRKIGHVVLNVADLDASVRFYTEELGLEASDRYPDGKQGPEHRATRHHRPRLSALSGGGDGV